MPHGEYDGYVTSKQKLCTLDAKSTYCNCMTEMHTAAIWDPILDNYHFLNLFLITYLITKLNLQIQHAGVPLTYKVI